jgi:hypothetical protein
MKHFPIVGCMLLAACATTPPPSPALTPAPQKVVSAAELVDHVGDSPETAITVPADVDEVKFENRRIYERFGKFRRKAFGIANKNDRHYDEITVELPDGSERLMYFDITALWQSWEKAGDKLPKP